MTKMTIFIKPPTITTKTSQTVKQSLTFTYTHTHAIKRNNVLNKHANEGKKYCLRQKQQQPYNFFLLLLLLFFSEVKSLSTMSHAVSKNTKINLNQKEPSKNDINQQNNCVDRQTTSSYQSINVQ